LDAREPLIWRGGPVSVPEDRPDAVICTALPSREELAALIRLAEPVVFISAAQLPYLRSIATVAPLALPGTADRARDRAEELRERVARVLETGVDQELALLDPLFQRLDPAEVAAARLAPQPATGSEQREAGIQRAHVTCRRTNAAGPLTGLPRPAQLRYRHDPPLQPRRACASRVRRARQVVGRRGRVRADPRGALRPRPIVPRLRRLAVLPAARHRRAGDRRARHLPRLRRRAAARLGAAVAGAPACDLPPVSPRAAARPSFSLARDSVGEPAVALAHVCMPVLPVVPPGPLRIRTGDAQRRELGVERTRLVREPVLGTHVDEQRGHRAARGRKASRQLRRIARGP